MKSITIVLILSMVIAGCAGMESSKSEPRKYLQSKNPITSEILSQMEFPEESVCLLVESEAKQQQPGAAQYISCSSVSVSSSLPYTMRVRQRSTNTSMNMEFLTKELCEETQRRSQNNQDAEILIPCSAKKVRSEEQKSVKAGPSNIYKGDSWRGYRMGKGTMVYANGDRYEGDFWYDRRSGKGTMVYANGDRYQGDFMNDRPWGKGIYTRANGDKYEGDFVDGKPTGKGIGTRPNGDRFEGDFVDGIPHGKGTVTWANGDRYEGDLAKGRPSGQGTVSRADGTKCSGVFKDGRSVCTPSCTAGDTGF